MDPAAKSSLLLSIAILAIGGALYAAMPATQTVEPTLNPYGEGVLLFDSAGYFDSDGVTIIVPMHGWVYETEITHMFRGAAMLGLKKALGLDPEAPESKTFETRVRPFLYDNERSREMSLEIKGEGERKVSGRAKSEEDGHFVAKLKVKPEHTDVTQRVIAYTNKRTGDAAHWRAPNRSGVILISDIDDTVKATNVSDRKEMLMNTFLREFEAVPEMASRYKLWAEDGAELHFVSGSPWQLYPALHEFFEEQGFPKAAWHLKRFRFKDESVKDLLADPFEEKIETIEQILERYPSHSVVLVGDSAEKDPEVYAEIVKRYAGRVLHVYIRNVTNQGRDDARYAALFGGWPEWSLFQTGADLPERFAVRESDAVPPAGADQTAQPTARSRPGTPE